MKVWKVFLIPSSFIAPIEDSCKDMMKIMLKIGVNCVAYKKD